MGQKLMYTPVKLTVDCIKNGSHGYRLHGCVDVMDDLDIQTFMVNMII